MRKFRKGERGQSFMETAIVVPIFLAFFLAVIAVGTNIRTVLAQADAVESGALEAAAISQNQGSCNGVAGSSDGTATGAQNSWDIYTVQNNRNTYTNQATSCSNGDIVSNLDVTESGTNGNSGIDENFKGQTPTGSTYYSDDASGALEAVWDARLGLQAADPRNFYGGHFTSCASDPTHASYGPCTAWDGDHLVTTEYVSATIPLHPPVVSSYITLGNITNTAYIPPSIGSGLLP